MAAAQKKAEELEKIPASRAMQNNEPTTMAQDFMKQQAALQQAPSAQIEQQAQQQPQQAQQQYTPYTGLQGISSQTAENMGRLQSGYQQSAAVTAAQQALQSLQDTRPGAYNSRYNQQLDQILQKITNPQQFKYSFDGDALFKNYADRYVQQGKQASMDAMGQAAGLTGGYGNSYGQMVGQQTYDQYLQGLYDKGMDLYDRAWQRYQAEQNGLLDQFNVLAKAEDTDYGRYRDTVGDWERERGYMTDRADTEANRDYDRYANELDYWTGMSQAENQGYMQQQQFEEQQRQFDAQLAENQRQWDQQFAYTKMSEDRKYAYNNACAILKSGKMPSDALLKQAGLSKEDAKKMMAQVQKAGGGGRGGSSKGPSIYEYSDGNLYEIGTDGKVKPININDVPDNAQIHTGKSAVSTLNSAVSSYAGTQAANAAAAQIANLKKKTNK